MHEIQEGDLGDVGGMIFVHPTGCQNMRLPSYVTLIHEKDGTRTLSGPVVACRSADGQVCNCFLIHDVWHVMPIARAS